MSDEKPTPFVLKNGEHQPWDGKSLFGGPYNTYENFEQDGTKANPIHFTINESVDNYQSDYDHNWPYPWVKNRLRINNDGLYASKSGNQQVDYVVSLSQLQHSSNGASLLSYTCDLSHTLQEKTQTLISFNWLGQTHAYADTHHTQIIPYTLTALDWQPPALTMTFHFLFMQAPVSCQHFLKNGNVIDNANFHFSLLLYYFED